MLQLWRGRVYLYHEMEVTAVLNADARLATTKLNVPINACSREHVAIAIKRGTWARIVRINLQSYARTAGRKVRYLEKWLESKGT